jgi:hypothetical protein
MPSKFRKMFDTTTLFLVILINCLRYKVWLYIKFQFMSSTTIVLYNIYENDLNSHLICATTKTRGLPQIVATLQE